MIDTVDDRGQRTYAGTKLASYPLAEKYLVWDWITAARSSLASGSLGADLYRQGYAPGVRAIDLDGAHIELRRGEDRAILISDTAKIFSHIMLMSIDELEQIAATSGR